MPRHGAVFGTYSFTPFGPASVPGHSLQLRAKELSLSDLDPVAAWADTSVNSNDFAQSTGANRPIYHANGGDPFVRFNQADEHWMTAGDVMDLGTNSMSIFIVAKRDALIGTFLAKTSGGGQGRWGWLYNAGDGLYGGLYQDSAGTKINNNTASDDVDAAFVLYELHIDRVGGSMDLYRDGVLEDSEALTPDSGDNINNANNLNLGNYLPGSYHAYLDADVKQIDAYLNANVVSGTNLTNLRGYYTTEFSL